MLAASEECINNVSTVEETENTGLAFHLRDLTAVNTKKVAVMAEWLGALASSYLVSYRLSALIRLYI